jgi:hypothetical protein
MALSAARGPSSRRGEGGLKPYESIRDFRRGVERAPLAPLVTGEQVRPRDDEHVVTRLAIPDIVVNALERLFLALARIQVRVILPSGVGGREDTITEMSERRRIARVSASFRNMRCIRVRRGRMSWMPMSCCSN